MKLVLHSRVSAWSFCQMLRLKAPPSTPTHAWETWLVPPKFARACLKRLHAPPGRTFEWHIYRPHVDGVLAAHCQCALAQAQHACTIRAAGGLAMSSQLCEARGQPWLVCQLHVADTHLCIARTLGAISALLAAQTVTGARIRSLRRR